MKQSSCEEYALTELRMAHQSQDIPAVQTALDNINAAKTAEECAQGEQGQGEAKPEGDAQGDDVQDVDYEEVKQRTDFFKSVNRLSRCKSEVFKINVEMYCYRY
jgi:hypothetical protein